MSLSLITLAADRQRDLPVSPWVFGVSIFAFFCILMLGLLMFGKGRPHA